jgi:hypothetical protein
LRRPPEEWRGVTFGADVGVNVHALTGMSVVFVRAPLSQRSRGAGSGLLGSGTTVLPFVVSLMALLLHRDLLRGRLQIWSWIAGPMVLSEFMVNVVQLLV